MGDAEAAPANRGGELAAEAARVRMLPAAEQGTKEEWMRCIRVEAEPHLLRFSRVAPLVWL